jgi:hypothetical protein
MRRCHTLVPRRPATSGEVNFTFTVPVDTVHGPETRHPGIVICERKRPAASERNFVGHLTRWEAAGKDNLVVRFLPLISSDIFQVSGIEGYRMPSIHHGLPAPASPVASQCLQGSRVVSCPWAPRAQIR